MNHEQRQTNWRNAFQVSGGEIYIFCDNCSSMRSIRSEINLDWDGKPGSDVSPTWRIYRLANALHMVVTGWTFARTGLFHELRLV